MNCDPEKHNDLSQSEETFNDELKAISAPSAESESIDEKP